MSWEDHIYEDRTPGTKECPVCGKECLDVLIAACYEYIKAEGDSALQYAVSRLSDGDNVALVAVREEMLFATKNIRFVAESRSATTTDLVVALLYKILSGVNTTH